MWFHYAPRDGEVKSSHCHSWKEVTEILTWNWPHLLRSANSQVCKVHRFLLNKAVTCQSFHLCICFSRRYKWNGRILTCFYSNGRHVLAFCSAGYLHANVLFVLILCVKSERLKKGPKITQVITLICNINGTFGTITVQLHSLTSNKLAKSLLMFGNFVRFGCFPLHVQISLCQVWLCSHCINTPLQNVNGQSLRRNQKTSLLHFK